MTFQTGRPGEVIAVITRIGSTNLSNRNTTMLMDMIRASLEPTAGALQSIAKINIMVGAMFAFRVKLYTQVNADHVVTSFIHAQVIHVS